MITRTALHARCATVVLSATMRVQNYAGSAKSAPGLSRDLFALFVQQYTYRYIISTDIERRVGLSAIAELLVTNPYSL